MNYFNFITGLSPSSRNAKDADNSSHCHKEWMNSQNQVFFINLPLLFSKSISKANDMCPRKVMIQTVPVGQDLTNQMWGDWIQGEVRGQMKYY